MKIIILEGIATSGKTTLQNKLGQYFASRGLSYTTVDEEVTLMPILENTDRDISQRFLQDVITKALQEPVDYLIFDRLYLRIFLEPIARSLIS